MFFRRKPSQTFCSKSSHVSPTKRSIIDKENQKINSTAKVFDGDAKTSQNSKAKDVAGASTSGVSSHKTFPKINPRRLIQESAERLYSSQLKSIDRDVDKDQLIGLRESQLQYLLSDELAAYMFREHTRKLVEENISSALDVIESRTGPIMGATQVVQELEKIIAFDNKLTLLSNHPEPARFALGVGPVSLLGGDYEGDKRINDLKLVYKSYVAESYSSGIIEKSKRVSMNHLKNIFGLGKLEAESIELEVTSGLYRLRLAEAVASGALDAADSKAAFLVNLCQQLNFNPDKAVEVHTEMYRDKLQQSLADGELNEADVAALSRLRVLLCVPQKPQRKHMLISVAVCLKR